MLVGIVARVRLSGKPHPERDGVRNPLRVGASAGDRRRIVAPGGARIGRHQPAHDLRLWIESERLVFEESAGANLRPTLLGELAHHRLEPGARLLRGERRRPAQVHDQGQLARLFGGERGDLRADRARLLEQLLGSVGAHPLLQLREMPGVRPHLGQRHLMGAERALGGHSVDLFRSGPALRGA